MCGLIWRLLPEPLIVRELPALVLIAAVVFACFTGLTSPSQGRPPRVQGLSAISMKLRGTMVELAKWVAGQRRSRRKVAVAHRERGPARGALA